MNSATLEPRSWSRRRWGSIFALILAIHLGLIFAFGDRKPVTPRAPSSAPRLRMVVRSNELHSLNVKDPDRLRRAAAADELLDLNDPTLFALPHRKGFSGAVWRRDTNAIHQPFRWHEGPRWLTLPPEKIGHAFGQWMTNAPASFQSEIKPAPELAMPGRPPLEPAAVPRSTLRLSGDLAKRQLLNLPDLPAWPADDLLTNNVAQVLVGADGNVISAKLLCRPPGSGSEDADRQALEIARKARFNPLPKGSTSLAVGEMIFEWQTVPRKATP